MIVTLILWTLAVLLIAVTLPGTVELILLTAGAILSRCKNDDR